MRVILLSVSLLIITSSSLNAQVAGCMDPAAPNYNSSATISDGSCTYTNGTVPLKDYRKYNLPAALTEISGMIYLNGKLYGHEDSGNTPTIYEIDTLTGLITKTITLQGATNIDWEDITQDDTYVYIGDFGNNVSGNRTNLKFYRFAKSLIAGISGPTGTIASADIATINFSYNDQTDFSATSTTRYDCEAVIYYNGNLHLFTKNWVSNYTVHYILPATPGTHVAVRKDSLDTQGTLITSATMNNDNVVTLLGYEVTGLPNGSLWIISGFNDIDTLFKSGNKRKVNLKEVVDISVLPNTTTGIGQVEGIAAVSQTRLLISNEFFTRTFTPFTFTIQQSLYGLDVTPYVPQYILPTGISNFTTRLNDAQVLLTWQFTDSDAEYFAVETSENGTDFDSIGKVFNNNSGGIFSFADKNIATLTVRYYRIKIVTATGHYYYSKTLPVRKGSDSQFNLSAVPSPFADRLDISFYSDKDQVVQLSVVDIYGRTVKTSQLHCTPGRYSYAMEGLYNLSNGIYFLTGRTKDNNLYVRKVVKQ